MNVLVLCGGASDEREVSLRSGKAVASALESAGHQAKLYDTAHGIENLATKVSSYDVVFPVLHGKGGEDGALQKILESLNVPFVGSGSKASELCFDKQIYKDYLAQKGYELAASKLVNAQTIWDNPLTKRPFVLKPNDGGSSIDTFIVRDLREAPRKSIEQALARHNHMLLEGLVAGIEATVAVLDNQALPVIEIIPPINEEFDYANKYNGKTQELCPPKNISQEVQIKLQDLALAIHRDTDCRHYSRTDIMVADDGKLVPLETNTIPGMTEQSLVPKAAANAGMSMPELVDILVHLAISE